MSVTETSKESFRLFGAYSGPALAGVLLALLTGGPKTIEQLAVAAERPQSTISGILRPLVKDGAVEHSGFSISSLGRRVRLWGIK